MMLQAVSDEDLGTLKELLTDQRAQLNELKTVDGDLSLHVAVRIKNTEITKFLVENGAVVDLRNNDGKTALHIAVSNEDEDLVDYLVSQDARTDLADNDGKTAEQLAIELENSKIMKKLTKVKETPTRRPSNPLETLLQAIKSEDTETVRELLSSEDLNTDVQDTIKENGNSLLHIAVKSKNPEMVNLLLIGGANVDSQNEDGNTALHLTAQEGDIAMGRVLQGVKAKANIANNQGDTPLHLAVRSKHVNIVGLLLSKFSVNINIRNNNGDTPLFIAVRVTCIQAIKDLLNSSQADMDVRTGQSNNGDSLLHIAARNKDPEMAKLLVQWGAPPNAQNNYGRTPLHIAADLGDEDMIKYLHAIKVNANITDEAEMTPIHLAANRGFHSIVSFFVDKFKTDVLSRSRDGSTVLHYACLAGQLDTSIALIKKGVLVFMPNKNGALCIHEAAKKGHVGIVKMLLEKGIPVNIKNKKNFTPLHLAAIHKKHQVAQLLIGHGADVTLPGGTAKETPLHMASKVKGGEKVVDVLIKSGADPDSAIQNGERALHLAARCGNLEVVRLLLREDAMIARRSKHGDTPLHHACQGGHYEIVKALIQKLFWVKSAPFARLIVNIPTDTGESALHSVTGIPLTSSDGNEDLVNIMLLLVKHGANLSLTTYQKRETPLHWCARSGNHQIMEAFFTSEEIPHHVKLSTINRTSESGASPLMLASQCGKLEVVRVLLRFQARVDVFDEVGGTALHYAASSGHVDVARELLNHKAYVNGRTKVGLTPLHIAAEKGFVEFVRMLVTKFNAIVDPFTVDKKTPLHLAAESGNIGACRVLLDLRADASGGDNKDMIPVHYAALSDREEIVELFFHVKPDTMTQINAEGFNALQIASSVGSIKVVKKLVELDFAKCSSDKGVLCKPLLLAASGGHTDIVEFLLESGGSPTEEDMEGMSVLHLAAKFGQLKVLDMLWGKTPVDRISVKNGMTAMHVAALHGQTNIIQEFLSRAPQSATIFSERPAELPEEDETDFGFTPLHLAAQNGDNGLVRLLANHPGVRVDAVTLNLGRTALHIAAQEGQIEVASTLISKVASLLHQVDNDGSTALHLAATSGHKELLTVLIGQGSEIDAQDKKGNTALHAAAIAGSLTVVKLLLEYGASSLIENKTGDVALCFAASERHIEVLDFLLAQKLRHERLLDNRKFLLDLVICSRTNNYQSLMKFVLSAPAPVHISSFLSRHFRIETTRNKENMVELERASGFCESVATDLISISCAEDSEAVLNSIDVKDVAFLDFLIECELKQCVSHTLVQQYVTQIWFGELKWEEWKFMLLFFVALLFPPLWIYLSLPFKNRHRQIPIIKFICRLISHLYLILLLCFTVVVPWKYSAADLTPHWYEYFLFIWIIGVLLSEISSDRERSGLGWFPSIVVLLSLFAELLRVIAIGFEGKQRIDIVFVMNQFLALALTLCVLLFLQFLSIHRLFGPWGVIIGHLVVDVSRFLLILMIFFAGFAVQMTAVYKPLYEDEKSYETRKTEPDFLGVVELLFFGLFGLTAPDQFKPSESERHATGVQNMTKMIFGIYNILCIIVLINLLIAMMSDTYQRLQEHSDVEWKFGRAKLIRNMERDTANPSPINLFTKVVEIFEGLYRKRCRCRVSGIASEQRANADDNSNDLDRASPGNKPASRRKDRSGEDFASAEWALIYSVVDWKLIVEKYMESKGERRERAKPITGRMRRKAMSKTTNPTGIVNQGLHLNEMAENTMVRMNVVNSLRV